MDSEESINPSGQAADSGELPKEGTHLKDSDGATAFDAPLMIGSSEDTTTGEPFRYFKGTLDNIRVAIYPSGTNNVD